VLTLPPPIIMSMQPVRIFHFVLDEKEFAFVTGVAFRGMTISQHSAWWNVVVRGYQRDGTPVYARTVGPEIDGTVRDLLLALSSPGGGKLWHFDRYANVSGR